MIGLRRVAILEAWTLILLFGVAMPLKYVAGVEQATSVMAATVAPTREPARHGPAAGPQHSAALRQQPQFCRTPDHFVRNVFVQCRVLHVASIKNANFPGSTPQTPLRTAMRAQSGEHESRPGSTTRHRRTGRRMGLPSPSMRPSCAPTPPSTATPCAWPRWRAPAQRVVQTGH